LEEKIWNLDTIPRHQTFLWRMMNNSLPVRDELIKRGINCSMICLRCNRSIETINHIMMQCIKAKIWFGCKLNINLGDNTLDFKDWVNFMINNLDKEN